MSNFGQNVLVLEDNLDRIYKFKRLWPACVITDTASACIEQLNKKPFITLFLDHDLNQEEYVDSKREDCGMAVVRWMCSEGIREKLNLQEVIVHSHNPNGAELMHQALLKAGYNSWKVRFGEGPIWKFK